MIRALNIVVGGPPCHDFSNVAAPAVAVTPPAARRNSCRALINAWPGRSRLMGVEGRRGVDSGGPRGREALGPPLP